MALSSFWDVSGSLGTQEKGTRPMHKRVLSAVKNMSFENPVSESLTKSSNSVNQEKEVFF